MDSNYLVQIAATGTIGSGVLFTGLTPPSGWDNFLATADDATWPYHGAPDSERYCLIARWMPTHGVPGTLGDWFFVGNGRTIVGGLDPDIPFGTGKLRFAVNRPSPDTAPTGWVIDPGDGQWQVTVEVFSPDASDIPDCTTSPGPNEACMSITGTLADMRTQASVLCEAITQARGDRDATNTAFLASISALGGAVLALAVFGEVVVASQAQIQGAATQAAQAALGSGAVAAKIAAVAVMIAAQIAASAPGAVRGGWVTVVIFAVLVALVAIAFIWFVAELLELLMRDNDLSIARSNFSGLLTAMESAIARAAMVCCSFDNSLPACSDF
jgi:hypothetical protein